jgi:hypothetical protein
MPGRNFCAECGERVERKGWRAWMRGSLCDDCAGRGGRIAAMRPLVVVAIVAFAGFALGRFVRPAPPPLIIQRAANSTLSDQPVNFEGAAKPTSSGAAKDPRAAAGEPVDENVYVCGARTQKGTPCRRRVHAAGERCYQHKGMKAMVPLEKLIIKP